ncbi:MAG: helix-turn-helix domain-containing protein [Roseiarcus sp.]|jgi:AraC-like DNA-binding protein
MIPVHSVSTDAIPQRDRFAYWGEAVSRQFTGMTVDATPEQRRNFSARLSVVRHAGVTSMTFERSAALAHRGAADIARFPSDNLLVYSAVSSPSWFRAHDGDEFVAPPGSLVVGFADVPFSHAYVGGPHMACALASLPSALIGAFRRGRRRALPRVIHPHGGLGALLGDYFAAWRRNLATLEGEAFDVAAHSLAQLAALAQGSADTATELNREAIAAARRAAAERFIARNLHRPNLSPAHVAAAIGTSVRRLHGLFEPTGVSVGRRIVALRLDKARGLLASEADLSVTEVAYRCGFDNLATFYRLFKAAFQMTASDFRAMARERR